MNSSPKKPRAKRTATPPVAPKTVLVTRFVRQDMSAYNGFVWPESGPVECPDWQPVKQCGNGLHGWLHGKGTGDSWDRKDGDRMLVVEILESDVIELDGKVKFPRGTVVHCGDPQSVSAYMAKKGHTEGLVEGTATAGEGGTATAGEGGQILLRWWQESTQRWRTTIAYVGENDIKANTPYKVDAEGNLVEVVKS